MKHYDDIQWQGIYIPAMTISLNKLTRSSGNPDLAKSIREAGRKGCDGLILVGYKHHAPYDGCFWEINHMVGKVDGNTVAFWAVYSSNLKQLYAENLYEAIANQSYRTDEYDFYPVDDDVHNHIHHNALRTIHEILGDQFEYDMSWHCDGLDEMTTEPPYEPSGYRGNGGVGVTLTGWYSRDGYEKVHIDLYDDGREYVLREDCDVNIQAYLNGRPNSDVFSYHYDFKFDRDDNMVEISDTSGIPDEIVDTYNCIYAPRDSFWLTGNDDDGYGFRYNQAVAVRESQSPLLGGEL